MDIYKLFEGIAVVIDDKINDPGDYITNILDFIKQKNIPIVKYDKLPSKDVIPYFSNAAFIILDWRFIQDGSLSSEEDQRVNLGRTFIDGQQSKLIEFIKILSNKFFIPIFIFTNESPETVKETLTNSGLLKENCENQIFIKQKSDVASVDDLFNAIEDWTKKMPSVYVLKEWENIVSETKHKMFIEMHSYSPNWAKIIWDMLKEDNGTSANHQEFGNFITKNLVNRIYEYFFDEEIIKNNLSPSPDELKKVVEGERYMTYDKDNLPEHAHTGDLFLENGKYFLNIRAQCDLSRNKKADLYLIKGKVLEDKDIITEAICLKDDMKLYLNKKNKFSLDEMKTICENEEALEKINKQFEKYRDEAFFINGNIIGKKSEIIIPCIAGKKALNFRPDIIIKKYNGFKKNLIGKILPPYITHIQQICSQYIIREGTMPTPKQIFEISDDQQCSS